MKNAFGLKYKNLANYERSPRQCTDKYLPTLVMAIHRSTLRLCQHILANKLTCSCIVNCNVIHWFIEPLCTSYFNFVLQSTFLLWHFLIYGKTASKILFLSSHWAFKIPSTFTHFTELKIPSQQVKYIVLYSQHD